MGWASGSALMEVIVKEIGKMKLPMKQEERFFDAVIEAFADHDCDTLDEVTGINRTYDKVLKEKFGETYE